MLLLRVRIKPFRSHTELDKREHIHDGRDSRETTVCAFVCLVLASYFRLNVPPAETVWKSEPLLFSAKRFLCNEQTMLV